MQKALDEEEQSDNALRTTHGAKWNRMPSHALNAQFKQQIGEYQAKVMQAGSTDVQIQEKLKTNMEAF
jgi:hypothetical protein